MSLGYGPPIAALISLLMTAIMAFGGMGKHMQDVPNERSLHTRPVPRSGGIAILLGIAVGWTLMFVKHGLPTQLLWTIWAGFGVAAVSLLDDMFELSPKVRFPVHLFAAFLVVVGGFHLPWGWGGWLISLLTIVWMLNLYNFMDGMDGFAGGMTLFGFGFLGWAGWLAGAVFYSSLSWAVAASSLGFLIFNFPPARIFMGDAGSATLGLLAAALSLWGYRLHLYPLWFPLLVFSPFIIDATVTLVRRGLRGEKVWQAHREHYYQRLVQAGWGHRKTVLIEYMLMIFAGCSGIWVLAHPAWTLEFLIGWFLAYVLIMLLAERRCGPLTSNAAGKLDHKT